MSRILAAIAWALPLSLGASAQEFTFADVTHAAGLAYPLALHGPGVSVGDFNGDGWLDVCICGGSDPSPQIFRNNGARITATTPGGLSEHGTSRIPWFTNVTDKVMPRDAIAASLALFADLDNDGDHDLAVIGRYGGHWRDTGVFHYVNEGGRYIKGENPSELARDFTPLGGFALADLDNDRDLDMVYGHNGGGTGIGGPGFYIRNDGLPNLVDATTEFGAGLSETRRYWSLVLADFDADRDVDLHCAIDFYSDFHCHNSGNGNFQDVTSLVHATNTGSDMGLAVGDVQNDGALDIYSTNINFGVLYVNDGQGVFTNEAPVRGVTSFGGGATAIGWGTVFSDLDNDQDQDLVCVAYGSGTGDLFRNDGAGYFDKVTAQSGLFLKGHGLVDFDYDKDGDVDLLVMRTGGQLPSLYENRSPALEGNHWLVIQPKGTQSNRDGVGARIQVTAGGQTMTRVIMAGRSFKSGPPMDAHFGLGTAESAEVVRVYWPSGAVQTLTNVKGDRYLYVTEPR